MCIQCKVIRVGNVDVELKLGWVYVWTFWERKLLKASRVSWKASVENRVHSDGQIFMRARTNYAQTSDEKCNAFKERGKLDLKVFKKCQGVWLGAKSSRVSAGYGHRKCREMQRVRGFQARQGSCGCSSTAGEWHGVASDRLRNPVQLRTSVLCEYEWNVNITRLDNARSILSPWLLADPSMLLPIEKLSTCRLPASSFPRWKLKNQWPMTCYQRYTSIISTSHCRNRNYTLLTYWIFYVSGTNYGRK